MSTIKMRASALLRDFNDSMLEEIDKSLEAASFYGFTPIKKPLLKKEDLDKAKSFDKNLYYADLEEELKRCHRIEEKICLLRNYLASPPADRISPLMLSYRARDRAKIDRGPLNLTTLGTSTSIAEIISIKASLTILAEQGSKDLNIEINSVGDKESFLRFEREFIAYMKKNLELLPIKLRQEIRKDARTIFKHHDHFEHFWEAAPKPINFLTPLSIRHLKEVLECLEYLEVPYVINNFLIPNRECCHHTVFRIKNDDQIKALGIRHCNLSRKIGVRKDIPLMTVVINDGLLGKIKKITVRKRKPKFYLVQFGNRAKIKSLLVIETLRKASIPIYHSLAKDKLVNQLTAAENLNLSYLLIIGEKEAMEESVAVRNIETRVQETVPIVQLASYLKKIKV
jgi:histidyl-tRNA synthetase